MKYLYPPAFSGFSQSLLTQYQRETRGFNVETSFSQDTYLDSIIHNQTKLLTELNTVNECECSRCQRERTEHYRNLERKVQRKFFKKIFNPEPLSQRVNLTALNDFLKNELRNRGISIEYDYGVYSKQEESFVIINGHYVVKDDSPQAIPAGLKNIYNAKYEVDLFPNEVTSPGLLMIHFPAKASIVWKGVWKNLLASIIFTGIILFCFIYTVQVIFVQKKLSEMKTDFINNMTHEF